MKVFEDIKGLFWKVVPLALFVLVMFVFVLPALAQATPAPVAGGFKANLPGIIVALAGLIFGALQLVKQFVPIKGWAVLALNLLLALFGAYKVADPGQVLSFQFLFTAVLASLGASGLWAKWQVIKGPAAAPAS